MRVFRFGTRLFRQWILLAWSLIIHTMSASPIALAQPVVSGRPGTAAWYGSEQDMRGRGTHGPPACSFPAEKYRAGRLA